MIPTIAQECTCRTVNSLVQLRESLASKQGLLATYIHDWYMYVYLDLVAIIYSETLHEPRVWFKSSDRVLHCFCILVMIHI